jgi:penicillin-binding protein 2B
MELKKNRNMNIGAVILTLIFILLFLFVMGRYFYIGYTHKVEGVPIQEYALDVWTKSQTIDAKRGAIYDRNGEVIAEDIPSYTVVAMLTDKYDNEVVDIDQTVAKLAPLLDMPSDRMREILSEGKEDGRFQVEFGSFGRKISHTLMSKINELDLSGIDFIEETKRYYPNQTFASHLIGFTKEQEEGERTGVMGLEKTLDEYLKESDGKLTYQSDGSKEGYKLPNPEEVISKPKEGYNVHLTIDEKIQLFVEEAMSKVQEKYNPKRMMAIVADPKTGKILAMSSRPSFNPNIRDIENYTNYAISAAFEPGSTMKIFTLAAAIQEGVYKGSEQYQSGSYRYSDRDRPIHDHNDVGWGMITFDEGVRRSSNVAFSIIAKEQLGYDRLETYLFDKFRLTHKTGIDLPNESAGVKRFKWQSEKISTAWGQGTSITPIQQIQAATAIANDGKMMKPFVIDKIVNPANNEVVVDHKAEVVGTPISSDTAKKVRDLLRTVVTDGTGTSYNIDGYEVAGKTGTAQISENGKWLTGWDDYVFSFIGMAPKDDPRLLVYVAIDRPDLDDEKYESGSKPVSQIFNAIMKNSLQYLSIEPNEGNQSNKFDHSIKLDDYSGKSANTVVKELESKGIKPVLIGTGDRIIEHYPLAGKEVLKNEIIFLKTEGAITIPDMTGWSRVEVLRFANAAGLDKVSISGLGFTTTQSIPTGESINENSNLVVKLEQPTSTFEDEDEHNEEKDDVSKEDEIE